MWLTTTNFKFHCVYSVRVAGLVVGATLNAHHNGRLYEKADVELRPWPERHSCWLREESPHIDGGAMWLLRPREAPGRYGLRSGVSRRALGHNASRAGRSGAAVAESRRHVDQLALVCLVDLGGDERRAACVATEETRSRSLRGGSFVGKRLRRTAIRVIEQHHCSVRLLQLILGCALSAGAGLVEPWDQIQKLAGPTARTCSSE